MKNRLFASWSRTIFGLSLSAFFLLATTVFAEPKPVLTLSTANPETILKIAGKIAKLTGTSKEFESGIASFRDLNGFDVKKPIVFVLHSEDSEFKDPLLYLPITDLGSIELPGFDSLMGQLKKIEDGKYLLNSPAGAYILQQKKSYVVFSPESSEMEVPDDPAKLITGLEKYTLGIRVDLDNTSAEAIQLALAPFQMLAGMTGGEQAMQAFEQFNQIAETLCKEFRTVMLGLTLDPETANTSFETLSVAKSGSEAAKMIPFLKNAKTLFSGFAGNEKSVVSLSAIADKVDQSQLPIIEQSLDTIIAGLLEQVEENAEEDEEVELAETVAKSLKKVIMDSLALEKVDYGFSFGNDGTFRFGAMIASTDELEKVGPLLYKQLEKKIPEGDREKFKEQVTDKIKTNYTTVNGYRLSQFVLPLKVIADEAENFPKFLAEKTFSFYWGLKDDSAVVQIGFDPNAEENFKKAIAATQNPVPVKQPLGVLSMQQLGTLLKTFKADDATPEAKQIVDAFIAAGPDAKITFTQSATDDTLKQEFVINGKIWETVSKLQDAFAKLQSETQNILDENENSEGIKVREFE